MAKAHSFAFFLAMPLFTYFSDPNISINISNNLLNLQATRDPKYVDIAITILNAIENRCKVVCGYAALKHVATGELEDRLVTTMLTNRGFSLFTRGCKNAAQSAYPMHIALFTAALTYFDSVNLAYVASKHLRLLPFICTL